MSAKTRQAVTVAAARKMFRDCMAQTSFFPRTNETYFPAAWTYGEGAGDASTADHYDTRKRRSAERVLASLAEEHDVTVPERTSYRDWSEMGTGDIAREIADAINAAVEADVEADAEDNE
jgi:hypothetical protein